MIFGNPHKFAILIDPVDCWSSPSFIEGLFIYIIDGEFYPRKPLYMPQAIVSHILELKGLRCLSNSVENSRLFNLLPEEAYDDLEKMTHVKVEDMTDDSTEDYTYAIAVADILLYGLGDVYLVSCGAQEKIIYKDPNTGEVLQVILESGYVKSVIEQIINSRFSTLRKDSSNMINLK